MNIITKIIIYYYVGVSNNDRCILVLQTQSPYFPMNDRVFDIYNIIHTVFVEMNVVRIP